ncbi:MAG: hypothetical protein ACRD4O_14680, partial [Bryobacteraceae bacterium]
IQRRAGARRIAAHRALIGNRLNFSEAMPTPSARDLAQRLLAHEAAADNSSESNTPAVLRVSEKLRRPLSTLAGVTGFRILLARALKLATAQAPGLSAVRVKPDGSLDGAGEIHRDGEADAVLIAQLLTLLATFIGEGFMLRLVQGEWPDLPIFYTERDKESEHDATR